MLLAELIRDLEVVDITGDIHIDVDGIAYDSRKVKKDYVFVCIDGMKEDGHNYVTQALKNGASALVVQREIGPKNGAPVIRSRDTRDALAFISDRFYGHISRRLNLIGVTGTKGKTTTTFMIKSILEAAGRKVGLIGTLGTKIGDRTLYSERTTPEALDLQELFVQMAEEGVKDIVMEVSSQGLALHRVGYCEFDTAVFTNLSRDHISPNEHASMEEYLAAKCMLFKMCKSGVINSDSQYAPAVIKQAECDTTTYGIDNKCDIMAIDIQKKPGSVVFNLVSPWYSGSHRVNIPGKFSIYNALAAIGVSGHMGISQEAVRAGLERVQVPGRAELVDTGRDFSVIIDYAHTPDSLENILSAVKDYARGRVICVFGCGGDRDKAKRPMMGSISGRLSDYTVITSDNPRTEDPDAIIADIEEGIKTTGGRYICISNRSQAVEHAIVNAQAGDVIVLAGKGHETYQIFADKTIHLDEREIVHDIIEKMVEGANI